MNILPKKRWHVRTKENIARVRRDEAKAAEDARELERRSKLADQEARLTFLRGRAEEKFGTKTLPPPNPQISEPSSSGGRPDVHVNLFQDLEDGLDHVPEGNKEREAEKKKEQEDYEKKIGLLTYLGQDSQEKSWWQTLPDKRNDEEEEDEKKKRASDKVKDGMDPLNTVRRYLGTAGIRKIVKKSEEKKKKKDKKKDKKKKKKKRRDSDSEEKKANVEKMRRERLERERKERLKAESVLYGIPLDTKSKSEKDNEKLQLRKKYNSQYNPDVARQNKLDPNKKYWLE